MTSPKVMLSPLRVEDATEMAALLSAAQIYEHIDDKPPTSADALRERYGNLVKQVSPDGREIWLNWIVRTGAPGAAIGYVQATIRKETNIALVAYVLSPNHWGKGLACEAVTQMIDKLSDGYGVKIFHATVDKLNQRSISLLKRLGFHQNNDAAHEGDETECLFEFQKEAR